MKKLLLMSKVKLGLIAVFVAALGGVAFINQGSAAPGQLYISPPSTSVQKGDTKSFQIRINPTTPVNTVEAHISYDKSKLQFVSVSNSGSPFGSPLAQTGGNGAVDVVVYNPGADGFVSGDVLVATVRFKALTGDNAFATLDLSGNAVGGSDYINPPVVDAGVTLTSPAAPTPTPPPSDDGGDDTTTPPSGGDDSTPPPSGGNSGGDNGGGDNNTDNQPVPGMDVKTKRVGFTRAVISVKTDKRTRAQVLFGTERDKLIASSKVTRLGTSHEISLPKKFLIPGTTYYYKVNAETREGTKIQSNIQTFKTKGYTLRMTLKDRHGNPLKRCKVTLHSEPIEATTDDEGNVTFNDVAPGVHRIEYVQDGETHAESVEVKELPVTETENGEQTAEPQEKEAVFGAVTFTEDSGSGSLGLPVISGIAMLALLGGAFLVMKLRNRNAMAPYMTPSTPSAPVEPSQPVTTDQDLINQVPTSNGPAPGHVVAPTKNDDEEER